MLQIIFKKQAEGKWRRDDGETKYLVSEERMKSEMGRRIEDGWKVELNGRAILRSVTLTKELF